MSGLRKTFFLMLCVALPLVALPLMAQAQQSELSVEQIMQDSDSWVGDWPSSVNWGDDGEYLYFQWNPEGEMVSDSLYRVPAAGGEPEKMNLEQRMTRPPYFSGWDHGGHTYTQDFSKRVFTRDGDLWIFDRERSQTRRLTHTLDGVGGARFTYDNEGVIFQNDGNLYRMELETGMLRQLTDLRSGRERSEPRLDEQQEFLKKQQRELFKFIRERDEEEELQEEIEKRQQELRDNPSTYHYGDHGLQQLQIDPQERFVTFRLIDRPDDPRPTEIHDYVTEDGYATNIRARPKVGSPQSTYEFYVQDLERDTTYQVDLHQIEGAYDVPAYLAEQGVEVDSSETRRELTPSALHWNGDGSQAVMIINAQDNKDRWIVRLDPETGDLETLDRQTDDAWIAGPGISGWGGGTVGWLPDNRHFYFQSEETGYSHLYKVDVPTGEITQLTAGEFEVFSPMISRDGEHWYFTSSEISPFVRHFYRMPIGGGEREQLTSRRGNNSISLNPDESRMANLYSFSNRPPDIYFSDVGSDSEERVTESPTDEWLAYDWREPEIIHFEASDGVDVPARKYMPENPNGSAVLFVHGAGYLQNVHYWWSSYFREYMFHNLLTDLGYVVLDVDFRASAGYGRDWRTAVYRHMGGRDLQDYVDASRYLEREHGISGENIGIYGGSYGGFITLMALFNESEHFGAGAALRSVTDWAHYNHGYTSNILNTPVKDPEAFERSSPINFAEGLEDPLLITHGVVDANVQYQDVVRLAQRLIELGKEDWEMAIFPIEPHGFATPSGWTDQYRRILKLFEENVRKD